MQKGKRMGRVLRHLASLLALCLPVGVLSAQGEPLEQPALQFDQSPRPSVTRDTLPPPIQELLPTRAIYAAGGGLTSSAWRIVIDLDEDTIFLGRSEADNASTVGEMDREYSGAIPPTDLAVLIALADVTWREGYELPEDIIADYDEIIVLVDGDDAIMLEGFGPFRAPSAAFDLVEGLRAAASARWPE
ncbi:MAG: hypothetical protein KC561_00930 [Myxococcales bacterium]|nr:hypothetical protein [Myxococcales bacterium]